MRFWKHSCQGEAWKATHDLQIYVEISSFPIAGNSIHDVLHHFTMLTVSMEASPYNAMIALSWYLNLSLAFNTKQRYWQMCCDLCLHIKECAQDTCCTFCHGCKTLTAITVKDSRLQCSFESPSMPVLLVWTSTANRFVPEIQQIAFWSFVDTRTKDVKWYVSHWKEDASRCCP